MIYGTLFSFPHQRVLIEAHCFGDCGKSILAPVVDPKIGVICPCREVPCPHLESEMAFPGTVKGEPVTFRKLK